MVDDRAGHPLTVGWIIQEPQQRGVGPHRDTGAQHTREQPGHKALTARCISPPEQPAADALSHPLGECRNALARHPHQEIHPPVVGARRRYRDAGLQHAGPKPGAVLAENRGVKWMAFAGAARGAATGLLGVVIGVVAGPEKPQLSRPAQHFDGLRDMGQKLGRSLRRRRAPYHRAQIRGCALGGVVRAGLPQHGGGGQPQGAAGSGGRTAHVRRLLNDQHRQPEFAGGQSRGHAGTRANHQQIDGCIGHGKPCGDRRAVRIHAQNGMPWPCGNERAFLISGTSRPHRAARGV